MRVRRTWFPLLFTGFLTSAVLCLYFVMVEKKASFSGRRFVEMLPTILFKENGKLILNFVDLDKVSGLH